MPKRLCISADSMLWTSRFREEFVQWKSSGVANLSGSLAYICCLALWITSPEFVRRRYFEVFYRTHILGFLGLLLFSAMHWRGELALLRMSSSSFYPSPAGTVLACSCILVEDWDAMYLTTPSALAKAKHKMCCLVCEISSVSLLLCTALKGRFDLSSAARTPHSISHDLFCGLQAPFSTCIRVSELRSWASKLKCYAAALHGITSDVKD